MTGGEIDGSRRFIYGPLPSARPLGKFLNGDTAVAFIYSASEVGMKRAALGPNGNPRTFTSIKSPASYLGP
jgi:hypothetical protein